MTHALPSAAPAYAVTAWVDDTAVYIQLRCDTGPPYVQRYAMTEGGLGKALALMRALFNRARPQTLPTYRIHPKIEARRIAKGQRRSRREGPKATPESLDAVRLVLKKAGVI